jgi:hypothetical protein
MYFCCSIDDGIIIGEKKSYTYSLFRLDERSKTDIPSVQLKSQKLTSFKIGNYGYLKIQNSPFERFVNFSLINYTIM